jgi:hypothetical protein
MTIDIIAAIITVSVLAVVYVLSFCADIRHCRSLRSPVERKWTAVTSPSSFQAPSETLD